MSLFARTETKGLDRLLNERVLIHTTTATGEETFKGVLVGNYGDCVELAAPALLDGDKEDKLKAPLVIPKDRIWFFQGDS